MEKLRERESEGPAGPLAAAPSLAVQFFLIPLAVVAVVVAVYGGFRMMVTDERTPEEYLLDVRTGGRDRRWPAAYELSRLMGDPGTEERHPGLGRALVDAFVGSGGDDPRIRRYLALAIGRLRMPPPDTMAALTEALDDADSETVISVVWALASLGDEAVVPRIVSMYRSSDAGVRKMAVYALGVLPDDGAHTTLRAALDDPAPDVQWNAAVALARHGRSDGLRVLGRMLDRDYVQRNVDRASSLEGGVDPVAEVMVSGLQAVGALKAAQLHDRVAELSRSDASLRVREVALRTLELLEPAVADGDAVGNHG
jgi:HEAT repeat protein